MHEQLVIDQLYRNHAEQVQRHLAEIEKRECSVGPLVGPAKLNVTRNPEGLIQLSLDTKIEWTYACAE